MAGFDFPQRVLAEGARLRPYAVRLTRDRDRALDLVQDSLLKALLNRDRFQEGSDLSAWMRTLARNTFINQYRHAKLGRRLEGDMEVHQGAVRRAAAMDDPLSELETEELRVQMNGLRVELRDPFLLHCEGFKYEEIAQRMGIPVGTVKSRIHQARQVLGRQRGRHA